MSGNFTRKSDEIIRELRTLLVRARTDFTRELVVVTGNINWCLEILGVVYKELELSQTIVVSATEFSLPFSTTIEIDKAVNILGHEFDHAIVNCHDGIDPNVLGAVAGTVRGGGLFILMLPELHELPDFDDPEKSRMAIWPYKPSDVGNRFLHRMQNILGESENIYLISKSEIQLNRPFLKPRPDHSDQFLINERCLTVEQRQAVEAILHVVDGHRRRPLVITADRGRGKSSALGIASADLIKRGNHNIIATGPRFSATEKIFEHAASQLMSAVKNNEIIYRGSMIRYMAVDAILEEHPECSLLIVDEDASISVNLLTKLLTRYSRVVFSTTTYGYEGTGRGFNLRFFDILNKTVPGWTHIQIKTPTRWAPDDPLEKFISRFLCLNADIAKLPKDLNFEKVRILEIDRDKLTGNQQELSAIFGLMVLAHYKTQPRDLRYLLDGLNLAIFVAQINEIVVGVAIVEIEGSLDESITQLVYKNERRVQGHLLPQSLESTLGIRNASQYKYVRVIRIITHPQCQRHGIGSKLIAHAENYARLHQSDMIGANFGVHNELLPFWDSQSYLPVHVGLASNTSTGTHSITVLKPLSPTGDSVLLKAKSLFYSRLSFMLTSVYKHLDAALVEYLFSRSKSENEMYLDENEIEDVKRFAYSLSDYDMASLSINRFINLCFYNEKARGLLTSEEKVFLIKKVLQQYSWAQVIESLQLEGKNQAIQFLRLTIAKLSKMVI